MINTIPVLDIGPISFLTTIVIGIVCLTGGGFLAYLGWQRALKKRSGNIIKDAEAEGEVIRKDKIFQAKEKFLQLRADHEKLINERTNKISQAENKFLTKEASLSQRIEEIQRKKNEVEAIRDNLTNQIELVEKKNEELSKMHMLKMLNLRLLNH